MTYRIPYLSFNTGQVSTNDPTGGSLEGRSNIEIYMSGVRTCSNWVPLPTGPAFKRPPFKLLREVDGGIKSVRFKFNEAQAYVFVFKDQSLTVFRDDVQVATGIVTPWTAAQLPTMRWLQQGDTFIGCHPDVATTKIVRSGSDASWTVSTISFTAVPQFDFGSGDEDAWSVTRGWPICGLIYQNRLLFLGSRSLPSLIWGSVSGEPFNFTVSVPDDSSFKFTLSQREIATSLDAQAVNDKIILNTTDGEYVERSDFLTQSSVKFGINSYQGMLNTGIRSLSIDTANVFVDRKNRLRSFGYDFNSDDFVARDLSVLAPGLLINPTQSAYIKNFVGPANCAMFRNSDGTLAVLTIDAGQKVQGWFTISLGGGTIRDICEVDSLYALIDYAGHTYLGKLDVDSIAYLDLWSRDTSVTAKTAWTGFTAFASQTVSVVGDGVAFDDVEVDGTGAFTLPEPVGEVYVGIPYTALLETLPLAPVVNGQLLRGKRIRKVLADVTMRNTKDIWLDGRRVPLRQGPLGLLDAPIGDFDSTKTVRLSGIGPEQTVKVESREPFGAMLLSLIVEIKMGNPQ